MFMKKIRIFYKKGLPYFVALVGVSISVILLLNALGHKEEQRVSKFKSWGKETFLEIEEGFSSHFEHLEFILRFYEASNFVSEEEFLHIADSFIEKNISHESIGSIVVQPEQESRFSLGYISPKQLKRDALEYDFYENKKFQTAMIHASTSRRIRAVLGKPSFIKDGFSEEDSYISFFASFHKEAILSGYLFSVLNLDYFLGQAIEKNKNVGFVIIDYLPNKEAKIIYSTNSNVMYPAPATGFKRSKTSKYSYENSMNIAGHRFYIEFFPNEVFFSSQQNNEAWFVFMISIVISLMVASYMHTSRRYTARVIKAQKEAEVANALQRDFLATMSHEIRTPMNAIIGMGDLLLDEGLEDQHASRVKTIVSAGEGLLQILNDILDFSKIEAGKLEMEQLSFSACEVVEDVADLHAIQAQNKGVELTVWQSSGVPELVVGDQGRVRQILNNLVGNAIKFTSKGHILVQIELIKRTSDHEAVLKFSVKDTGVGIPKEAQALIFDRFRQADSSTTRQFGGTGLGLAICKKLTLIMKGDMGVESKENVGSNFWFTTVLPIDDREYKKIDLSVDLGGAYIAVIDDVRINLDILKSYLERWNAKVAVFSDPEEAFTNIEDANTSDYPYDIILTDHLMPSITGIKLMQALRQNKSVQQSPAIVISSYMDAETSEAMEAMDDVYHLSKPIHPARLKSMLLKLLGRYKDEGKGVESMRAIRRDVLPQFENLRVLVAEDNYANQEIAERILERMGCSVTCVGNGREAVDILKTLPFDLVFMDCQMPEMDGFEATKVIKELMSQDKIKAIPIVALTANAMKGDRDRCLDAGMQDYVSKPVKKKTFSDVLAKWLPHKMCMPDSSVVNISNDMIQSNSKADKKKTLVLVKKVVQEDMEKYAEPLFDEGVYGELKEMIGDDAANSVLIKYTNTTKEDKENVSEQFEKRNYLTISEYAHKLKSSSAQIGAVRLSRVSADIESYLRDGGDIDEMASYVSEYQTVLDDTLSALEKRVASND